MMMHSKINPILFRLNRKEIPQAEMFKSCWFTTNKKKFKDAVEDDLIINWAINTFFENTPFSYYRIKRFFPSVLIIEIYTPALGSLIGQKAVTLIKFKEMLNSISTFKKIEVQFFVSKKTAHYLAQIIKLELVKGVGAWVKQVRNVLRQLHIEQGSNLLGYKIQVTGRINGSEKTKQRIFREGAMPLHTLESNVDYAMLPAITNSGSVSVKVWICTKERIIRFKNKLDDLDITKQVKKLDYEK